MERTIIGVVAGLILAIAIVVTTMGIKAHGGYDPFVARLEMLFGVHPGGYIPVDMRAPDVRLQYLGARPVGNGDYEIRLRRVR